MKTPLGTEVDIGAGHIVLDGFPALRERGTAVTALPPSFRPMSIVACGHGRPSQLLLSSCLRFADTTCTKARAASFDYFDNRLIEAN